MLSDVDICEDGDISKKIDYFYSKIEAYGFLESCPYENSLEQLMSKVAKEGTLKIQGVDLYQATDNFSKGQINTQEFSSLVIRDKIRATSLHDLIEKINQSQEFKIQYAGLSGLNYILEAKRI
jgi:hypothetical protein